MSEARRTPPISRDSAQSPKVFDMKRVLIWLVAAVVGAWAALSLYPPARVVLDLMPAVKTVVQGVLPASETAAPKAKGKGGPPPAPVTIAKVVLGSMPVILTAPGTVEAEATVAVKSRVDGQIADVLFKEGDFVKKGQELFRLDDRLILAQIRQAEANIQRDQVNLAEALATLERRNTLVQKRIVSEAAMDTAKTSVEALRASIAAGQAALEAQKTQLDYLVIRAPIEGRTGSTTARPGSNIRAADAAALVTINQIRPIAVTFSLPQVEIGALKRALAAGASAEIRIAGSVPMTRRGRIDFIDNQVDRQTGTLAAKVEVPNEDEVLWPGQSVEIVLEVERRPGMLSVPASAVLPSQQGMIVWVVGSDGRAVPRQVALDRIIGQTAYLREGVSPDEAVVTDGQVRLAPGAPVAIREPGAPKGPPHEGKGSKGPAPPGSKPPDPPSRTGDRRS